MVNGVVTDTSREFGGTIINLGGLPDATYAFNTAHTPGGASNTRLILYSSTWQERARDYSTSGPWYSSRMASAMA